MKAFVHTKTGNIYYLVADNVIDCTNSRDNTTCVLYTRDGKLFVRERNEFYNKFKEL